MKGEAVSAFSEAGIKGHAFSLEDGRTKISMEEAHEWTMCCRFSCLGSGYHMNPW